MMVVAFALDMIIIQTTAGPPILNPDIIGSELLRANGMTIWLVEGWLYTLMIVPAFIFVLGVYWMLRDADNGLAGIGLFASALFWTFHTLHNVVMLSVIQVLAPRYATYPSEGTSIEVVARTLLGLANLLFGFGGSVGGLFPVAFLTAFGLATLKSRRLPRWAGYVALASGFAILLSYLQFVSGAFMFLGLLGWVLSIVWVVSTTAAILNPTSHAHLVAETSAA
jgi:hypothetical protein